MNAVLLAALLVQQTTVSASVSTENVRVGEEVVLTVEFRTHVSGPAEVEPLNIQRLELIGTNQSSVFRNTEDGSERHTTWTYRLRATRAGTGTIGPIRVTVGSETVATPPMDVTIEAVVQPATPTIAPRILRLVRGRLSPRAGEEAVVRLVTSRDTVVVGEQLDLIVMAWVSREVQSRMQTRPYLTPPTVDGAWTYPRTSFLAVVDSQRIGGELFDLFVHHQVVFPLVSGTLHATPATFSYNVPLRTSLLRRDSPREVQTDAVDVTVLEQPEAGKPDGFSGAAGQDLVLTMSADSAGFGVGNAGTVTATVSGRGNVSMWPEPIILWPEGLRVYPAGTGVSVDTARGLIGGSKTFSYLVAPDSVGAYLIPQASYHYFDVERLRYRTDRAEPVRLLANAVRSAGLAEFTPLPLLVPASRAGWQHRIRSLGPSTLVASILLVPLLAITWVFARGLFAGERPKRKQKSLKGFDRAAQDFHQKLQVLVRQETLREGDGLVAALRAAGVEAPVALHAARVRDRLRMARYGPPDATDIQELAAEVAAVIEALPPTPPRGGRFAVTASVFAFLLAGSAVGQAPNSPPEVLYEAGAFLAAAAEFESRARLEPHVE
ncbi:MAG: BatD family protein, partial [Gemmatimonadota bacterium]|nr:BatD family protein [Gemmatimonadota bacterium]